MVVIDEDDDDENEVFRGTNRPDTVASGCGEWLSYASAASGQTILSHRGQMVFENDIVHWIQKLASVCSS